MHKIFSLCALSMLLSSTVYSPAIARQSDTVAKNQAETKRKSVNRTSAYGLLLGALVGGYQGAFVSESQNKVAAALGLGTIGSGLGWICSKQLLEDETAVVDGLEHGACGLGATMVGYMVGLAAGMFGRTCVGYNVGREDTAALRRLQSFLSVISIPLRLANDINQMR